MKKFLFVLRKPPHSGIYVQETLDIILTTAAFDQPVSLLFLDDGIFQIKSDQQPDHLHLKDTAAIFKALEIYSIDDFYAEVESMQERDLKPGNLILPVQEILRKDTADLCRQFDVVYGS